MTAMKPLTNFLLAVAALVTALTAFVRATDEPAAVAGYEELSRSVEALSRDVVGLHDDVSVLWDRTMPDAGPVECASATPGAPVVMTPLVPEDEPKGDHAKMFMRQSAKPAPVKPAPFAVLREREGF